MSNEDVRENIPLEERALRATAALYRVTDILPDEEPMKWKMRRDAIEINECIEPTVNRKNATRSDMLEQARNTCYSLRGTLAVAGRGGFIARLNFQILEKEYVIISDIVSEMMAKMSDTNLENIWDISIGHNFFKKDIGDIQKLSAGHAVGAKVGSIDSKKTKEEPSSSNERQESIKKILHKHGWLGLGEITSLYGTGVSAKTVQRDLITLTESGIVQSRGEKRWRKYALPDNVSSR